MAKFVVFEGDGEVIVTTKKNEKKTLDDYFKFYYIDDVHFVGTGDRNLKDYNRYEINGSEVKIWSAGFCIR